MCADKSAHVHSRTAPVGTGWSMVMGSSLGRPHIIHCKIVGEKSSFLNKAPKHWRGSRGLREFAFSINDRPLEIFSRGPDASSPEPNPFAAPSPVRQPRITTRRDSRIVRTARRSAWCPEPAGALSVSATPRRWSGVSPAAAGPTALATTARMRPTVCLLRTSRTEFKSSQLC